MPPCFHSSPSIIITLLCVFSVCPGLPVLRLSSPSTAIPGVVVPSGRSLLGARPRNDRGIQSDVRFVVMLTFAATPTFCRLPTVHRGPGWIGATATTPSYLVVVLVELCLLVELICRVVLTDTEIRVVGSGLVGVVVSVLPGIDHQWPIQMSFHVRTNVAGKVDLQGQDGEKVKSDEIKQK